MPPELRSIKKLYNPYLCVVQPKNSSTIEKDNQVGQTKRHSTQKTVGFHLSKKPNKSRTSKPCHTSLSETSSATNIDMAY